MAKLKMGGTLWPLKVVFLASPCVSSLSHQRELVLVEGLFPCPMQVAELWWRPLQVMHLTVQLQVGFFVPSSGPLTLLFAIGPSFFTTKGGSSKGT